MLQTIQTNKPTPGAKIGRVRLFLINNSEYFLAPKDMKTSEVRKFIERKFLEVPEIALVSFTDKPKFSAVNKTFGAQIQEMDLELKTKPQPVYFD